MTIWLQCDADVGHNDVIGKPNDNQMMKIEAKKRSRKIRNDGFVKSMFYFMIYI